MNKLGDSVHVLENLESRQDDVLRRLDDLNCRIQDALRVWTPRSPATEKEPVTCEPPARR